MRGWAWAVLAAAGLAACAVSPHDRGRHSMSAAAGPERAGWTLIWADEFDRDGAPDPAKWKPEVGMIRNGELQYYTDRRAENARVEGGMLILEARRETWEKAGYTSASLTTADRASWTYGRIEVRAKIPSGRGLWPAIWMLGNAIGKKGWPACGEIDIMENVGYDHDKIHCTVHTKAYNHVKGTQRGKSIDAPAPSADFHLYAADWSPQEIVFTFDGREVLRFPNEGTGEDAWPFDQPHYLILNVAVGGGWGGQKGVDESVFPQRMVVDYARVYRRSEGSAPAAWDVRDRVVQAMPVAVVKQPSNLRELPDKIRAGCGEAWNWVKAHPGVKGSGRMIVIYHNTPGGPMIGPDQAIPVEIGAEVEAPFTGDGRIVPSAAPAGRVLTVAYYGPYENLRSAYDAIFAWGGAHGCTFTGVNWEHYGHWDDDPAKRLTDVYCQIKE